MANSYGTSDVTRGYAGTDSAPAYGIQTNPTANTAVATLAAPGAGVYEIVVQAGLTGTIAAGDLDNMNVRHGATVIGQLLVPPVADQQPTPVRFPRVTVAAAEAITVNAVANASGASAKYHALIIATKVA